MDRGSGQVPDDTKMKKDGEVKRAKLLLSAKEGKVEEITETKSLLFTRVPKEDEKYGDGWKKKKIELNSYNDSFIKCIA